MQRIHTNIHVVPDLRTCLSCLQVMNEIVVDRGSSPFLTNIEIFCNQRLMTTVQGDGEEGPSIQSCTFITF